MLKKNHAGATEEFKKVNCDDYCMEKINKSMTFQELLQKYPAAGAIIEARGLHCLGCSGALFESIEQGSKMHGLGDAAIDEMIEEINSGIAKDTPKGKKSGQKSKGK